MDTGDDDNGGEVITYMKTYKYSAAGNEIGEEVYLAVLPLRLSNVAVFLCKAS